MSILQAPRGTADTLPADSVKWRRIESVLHEIAALYGLREIRFPTFEYTELFQRGVGETTDVVQKEMYTFEDRGGRSVTLRPEGTASTVRALLQNGLHNEPMPLGLYYMVSCFRGEKPQAGRLREFHQFGVELFGSEAPAADVEIISLAAEVYKRLGIAGLRLELNSIGCPDCRRNYHEALREYFRSHISELCETCRSRLERNPMRILDCKSPECAAVAKDAPVVLDYICDGCKSHFEEVKARLKALSIDFTINPKIVRGLDYYTRTVFEFVSDEMNLTACGGGRYDGLVEQLGGPKLPALGFGMGIERLLILMKENVAEEPRMQIYFAPLGEKASTSVMRWVSGLRAQGVAAASDLMGRSVKAQMKYADKLGAQYTVVVGDNELEQGTAMMKNMKTGETVCIPLDDNIIKAVLCALERADS